MIAAESRIVTIVIKLGYFHSKSESKKDLILGKIKVSNQSITKRKRSSMAILNTISLKSNKQININFNGGDLSSDGGLLLIKEFAARIGLFKLYSSCPYKREFYETLSNIQQLQPRLE